MAVTPQQIIDKSFRIAAATATDGHNSPVIDNIFVLEDYFRTALRGAVIEQRFTREFALTLTDGAVALPDGVIIESLPEAEIVIEDDTTPTSIEIRYVDYRRAPLALINYAHIKDNNRLLFREAGEDESTFDGALTFSAIALPVIPATLETAIDIPSVLADRTSEILAQLINGIKPK